MFVNKYLRYNAFRHCRVRFYASLGPFSKQLYTNDPGTNRHRTITLCAYSTDHIEK